MSEVLAALAYALRNIWHPKMLSLAIWPMLVALTLWLTLAWINWDSWSSGLSGWLAGSLAGRWLSPSSLEVFARYSALLLLAVFLIPLIFVTAVLVAAMFEMPQIVGFVASRDFATLAKQHGGTVPGSIANALIAVLVFGVLWVATLPLWLTGVLAPVVSVALSAYLNQRLFRYDALSDHASASEYWTIVKAKRTPMFVLGFLLGMLYFVPLLNLLAPVISGLAFAHFGLSALTRLRQTNVVLAENSAK